MTEIIKSDIIISTNNLSNNLILRNILAEDRHRLLYEYFQKMVIILITKTNYSDWVDQSIRYNRPTCHFNKIPIPLTIHSDSKAQGKILGQMFLS